MHRPGLLGKPGRVYAWDGDLGWTLLNLVSSISSFVLAGGFALVLVDVIRVARFGRRTRRNPWNAGTLEWAMPTPPPAYNIGSQPEAGDRHPLHEARHLPAALARVEGYLRQPPTACR